MKIFCINTCLYVKRGFQPTQHTRRTQRRERKERNEMTSLLDRQIAAASEDVTFLTLLAFIALPLRIALDGNPALVCVAMFLFNNLQDFCNNFAGQAYAFKNKCCCYECLYESCKLILSRNLCRPSACILYGRPLELLSRKLAPDIGKVHATFFVPGSLFIFELGTPSYKSRNSVYADCRVKSEILFNV